jgi:quercetin dioxygenase-like cupin family protein
MRTSLLVLAATAPGLVAQSGHAEAPTRTMLASTPIGPAKLVERVDLTRVDFAPGQSMPPHMHPVPVLCFVTKGDFKVRIGDAPEQPAPLGSVTYEPAGVTIHYFTNASTTMPAQLNCAVLAGAEDKVTSVMLDHPAP